LAQRVRIDAAVVRGSIPWTETKEPSLEILRVVEPNSDAVREAMEIAFFLNGTPVKLDVAPDRRVVDLLREDLGLTGTKEACGTGDCGACTILVDNESRLSCLMLAAQLDGRTVATIEGLSQGESLHVIQEAFIECGAVQCGFCTPGMVASSVDLLHRIPSPTRQEIREGLSGNLCRCTGYQKIVDAVELAVRKLQEDR